MAPVAHPDDPFALQRFVSAQARDFAQALAELRAGHKRSHWIWHVLPQLAVLGRSERARRYGLASLAEAQAYLAHPLLGPRLRGCVEALLAHAGTPVDAILGEVDALKCRSCLTLFRQAAGPGTPAAALFEQALQAFYGGRPDPRTLQAVAADLP
jgi:uncharacterized protein (DUF1810 family)